MQLNIYAAGREVLPGAMVTDIKFHLKMQSDDLYTNSQQCLIAPGYSRNDMVWVNYIQWTLLFAPMNIHSKDVFLNKTMAPTTTKATGNYLPGYPVEQITLTKDPSVNKHAVRLVDN